MTEETINATQEVFVFVPLFKNVYESSGKKLISYKPGYVPKDAAKGTVGTFPVGLGDYDTVTEGEFTKEEYHKKFRLSVAVNSDDKGDLVVTLNDVDDKTSYQKIYLNKQDRDGKTSYSAEKPVEVAGKRYRVNLNKNTKEEKPQALNLTFKDAGSASGGSSFGSEQEISFDDLDI